MTFASRIWPRAVIPDQHRSNFIHLTMDIAWFGVLNGSAIAFAAVFAARQGASPLQVGLLNASPALITLLLALPTGRWLQNRSISHNVFLSSILHRLFYLVWIFLPLALTPQNQVWVLIVLIALMSIPGTVLAVGFNALFAAAVPMQWRAYVTGTRNAAFALTSILTTLSCGWLLKELPFPLGYQLVFAIGFLGAALSSFHLWFIRPLVDGRQPFPIKRHLVEWAQPGIIQVWHNVRTLVGLRLFTQHVRSPHATIGVIHKNKRFRLILLLVFFMHLTLFLGNPLFPIYLVKQLQFSDQEIALGNSLFYLTLFLGSTQLGLISGRIGHRRTLAGGMMLTCLYPALIAITQGLMLFLLASILGGLAWTLAGGALANYILEETPPNQQPLYLAWYNIALQSGVLMGALSAPIFANWLGIVPALMVAAVGRLLSGLTLWQLSSKAVPNPALTAQPPGNI